MQNIFIINTVLNGCTFEFTKHQANYSRTIKKNIQTRGCDDFYTLTAHCGSDLTSSVDESH